MKEKRVREPSRGHLFFSLGFLSMASNLLFPPIEAPDWSFAPQFWKYFLELVLLQVDAVKKQMVSPGSTFFSRGTQVEAAHPWHPNVL
jgi:hypothetical protein